VRLTIQLQADASQTLPSFVSKISFRPAPLSWDVLGDPKRSHVQR
jgi:hypothetical protein